MVCWEVASMTETFIEDVPISIPRRSINSYCLFYQSSANIGTSDEKERKDEKSNCFLWVGNLVINNGYITKACEDFTRSKEPTNNKTVGEAVEMMINEYGNKHNNR